jgi:hypothetical protein
MVCYFNNLEQGQTELTNFKSEHIEDFHWSFDGSKLGTSLAPSQKRAVFWHSLGLKA